MITQQGTYTSYQLSAVGVGAIATGLEDIRQCIDFILRTIPGSDPLRPLFGSDIYRFLDRPVNVAVPNMKKAIFEALDLWEKRIVVKSITHEIVAEVINFNITYGLLDESILDTIIWSANGIVDSGTGGSGIILQALIPVKIAEGTYNVIFTVNDAPAYPAPPSYGFATAQDLLSWVSVNWFNYGSWYIAGDKLILYLAPGMAKKATLVVTQKAVLIRKAYIPVLAIGEYYNLSLLLESVPAIPDFPADTISSLEQLLLWVSSNWGAYGSWAIDNAGAIITSGDFSEDFNNDFLTEGILPERYLVFQTELYTSATLIFT